MELTTEKGNPGKKTVIRYALGLFISNLLWFVFGQAQFFAGTVLLIPLEYVTIAMVVFAIADGINDPILGYLSDKSKKYTLKYGKRYPWIIIGIIGASFAVSLIFLDIFNAQENPVIGGIWFCITLILFDSAVSLHDINSTALFTDKFRDEKLRVFGGGMMVIFATLGMLVSIVIVPMTTEILTGVIGEKLAFLVAAVIMSVICVLVVLLYRKGVHEDEDMRKFRAVLDEKGDSHSPFLVVMKRAFKDRNFLGYVIVMFTYNVLVACMNTGLAFWVTDGIGLTYGDVTLPMVALVLAAPISVPLWLFVVKKAGTKWSMILGSAVFTIGAMIFYFISDITGAIIVFAILGIALGGNGVVQVTIFAQCVDNAAVLYGKREESTYNGIYVLFVRLSTAIQATIFLIVASSTGYDPELGFANSEAAKGGLKFQMSIVPAVTQFIGLIAFWFLFKLTPQDTLTNTEKLKEMGL